MDLLVIDDNAFQRRMLGRLLRDLGHQVREATDGDDGVRQVVQAPPVAVFTDLLMPGMDGFGVLARLRQDYPTLPVFVLSADIQDASRQRALDLGATGFLNKPATPASLSGALAGIR